MRRSVAAAAVVAATALLAGGTAVPAQAHTKKELKICWLSPKGTNYPAKFVIDGPTSRSATLASGSCQSWDVRAGEYKVVFASLSTLSRQFYNYDDPNLTATRNSLCGDPGVDSYWDYWDSTAYVKRFKNDYVSYELEDYANSVRTTVQKNRLTKINVRFTCGKYNYI